MANGWTPERRQRQAELIRAWRPWERSTGPVSEEGKKRSAGNSTKHGARSARWKSLRREMREAERECRELMDCVM